MASDPPGQDSGDKRGPDPQDEDLKILRIIRLQPDPFATARDVEPETDVGYKQTRNRMDDLVDKGLLKVRTVGTTNVYWISDRGAEALAEQRD